MSTPRNASPVLSMTSYTRVTVGRVIVGLLVAAIGAALGNTLIVVVVRALGASSQFTPLNPVNYVGLTVFGVLLGAAGWAAVRRFSANPARVLRWLVPAVVVVSWAPDILLLAADLKPHTSGVAVAGLMLMHVTTTALALPVFARVLPLPIR